MDDHDAVIIALDRLDRPRRLDDLEIRIETPDDRGRT
jgi:hypothetical protein